MEDGFGFRKPVFSRKCWLPDRLQLPGIQKLVVSASISVSLKAVFDGFGLGFGYVIFFTAGFGFGFGFPDFVSGFRGSIGVLIEVKTFIHKLRFDFYLPAGDPFCLYPLVAQPMPLQ